MTINNHRHPFKVTKVAYLTRPFYSVEAPVTGQRLAVVRREGEGSKKWALYMRGRDGYNSRPLVYGSTINATIIAAYRTKPSPLALPDIETDARSVLIAAYDVGGTIGSLLASEASGRYDPTADKIINMPERKAAAVLGMLERIKLVRPATEAERSEYITHGDPGAARRKLWTLTARGAKVVSE